MSFKTGKRNLITDVAGLTVGNADDLTLKSGVTVVLCDKPTTAAVQVLGGAPGTSETDLLEPHNIVDTVDSIVLSGGSAFGLEAASGVRAALAAQGRGFAYGELRIPIVPSAILFDLTNGGDKNWGERPPYFELGRKALANVRTDFEIGTFGAGAGAFTAGLKGGLGSASTVLPNDVTVAALVAVNAAGSTMVGDTRHFWSAPFEIGDEFGGLGLPHPMPSSAQQPKIKHRSARAGQNTTIAVIATDAILTSAGSKRLAIAAHDGFSRAIWPVHTPVDGDLVFALATGASNQMPDLDTMMDLHAAAVATMARAIARAIHAATPAPGDIFPCWA
jgi:L-aminopeptidase/D-esterase-like protein